MRRVIRGAMIGSGIGAAFLAVGVVRAVIFLLGGGSLRAVSADDLRFALFYVGGFGVAGAMFAAVRPYLRSKVGAYTAFAVAGMIVTTAIKASEKGGLGANDTIDWVVLLSLGALFGCAFARGLLK